MPSTSLFNVEKEPKLVQAKPIKALDSKRALEYARCHDTFFTIYSVFKLTFIPTLNLLWIFPSWYFVLISAKNTMAQKSIEKNSLSSSSVQIKHEWRSREDGHHCFLHWHWKPYSETKDFFDRLSYSSECSPLIRTKVSLTQRKGLSWKRTCLDSYCMNLLTFTHLQSSITELHPEQLSSVDFNCGS